ncbi:hypothetical protein J7643_17675 [bacterium]|nr:hypothetical protein [bacterium]
MNKLLLMSIITIITTSCYQANTIETIQTSKPENNKQYATLAIGDTTGDNTETYNTSEYPQYITQRSDNGYIYISCKTDIGMSIIRLNPDGRYPYLTKVARGVTNGYFKFDPSGNIWALEQDSNVLRNLGAPGLANGSGITLPAVGSSFDIRQSNGMIYFISESGNNYLYKYSNLKQLLSTITKPNPSLNRVYIDKSNNVWLYSSTSNSGIYKLTNNEQTVTKYPLESILSQSRDSYSTPIANAIIVDDYGNAWVSAYSKIGAERYSSVTKISPDGKIYTYKAGNSSFGITIDRSGCAWVLNKYNANVTRLSRNGLIIGTYPTGSEPVSITCGRDGNILIANYLSNSISKINVDYSHNTASQPTVEYVGKYLNDIKTPNNATSIFWSPTGLTISESGEIYTSEVNHSSADMDFHQYVKRWSQNLSQNIYTTGSSYWGYKDGVGSSALYSMPYAIALDNSENIYVADSNNQRIRKVFPDGTVTTIAGGGNPLTWGNYGPSSYQGGFLDGNGTSARFNNPKGIAIDNSGNIYVADTDNNRIRKIAPNLAVSTFAGDGTRGHLDGKKEIAKFDRPTSLTIDKNGNIFIAEEGLYIRVITPSGEVSTVAGTGLVGKANGFQASFTKPVSIAADSIGNLYVADNAITTDWDATIRKIYPDGFVSTIAGRGNGIYDQNWGSSPVTLHSTLAVAVDKTDTPYFTTKNHLFKIVPR